MATMFYIECDWCDATTTPKDDQDHADVWAIRKGFGKRRVLLVGRNIVDLCPKHLAEWDEKYGNDSDNEGN